MPTSLDSPFAVQKFTHSDGNAVEYLLHPRASSVRVRSVGDSCRVHCGNKATEGKSIRSQYAPLADGELSAPFRYASVGQASKSSGPRSRARVEGRSLFVAIVGVGPADVLIVSEA